MEPEPFASNSEIAIKVKSLSKAFQGKKAVKNVSIQVNKGEIFGFLGPNGSGKTTTIRMICGLLTPDSGEGTCLGMNIRTQADDIKREVGYMPQSFSLYRRLSVYENLDFVARVYGLPNRRRQVKMQMDLLGFSQHDRRKQAGQLSGGWKKRLELASALLHKPKILLLDEPTAGVDPKARRAFWDIISNCSAEGVTTLVSTHYMDEAERCNRMIYLSLGDVLVEGSKSDIIEKANIYTWQVGGPRLIALKAQLESEGLKQVAAFGQTLHVSDAQKESTEAIFRDVIKEPNTWRSIDSSLEDAFISLIKNHGV